MHYNHENCFPTYIVSILDHHGLSYVWKTQVRLGHNNQIRKSLAKEIKTRLTDISPQTIFDHLHNISHKLNFLSELKQTLGGIVLNYSTEILIYYLLVVKTMLKNILISECLDAIYFSIHHTSIT